jgi:excisionase family DNA binding protein
MVEQTKHNEKRYYRVDEVADYFRVSNRTIYRLIELGDIKAIRLRECIRIPAEEIRECEKRWSVEL